MYSIRNLLVFNAHNYGYKYVLVRRSTHSRQWYALRDVLTVSSVQSSVQSMPLMRSTVTLRSHAVSQSRKFSYVSNIIGIRISPKKRHYLLIGVCIGVAYISLEAFNHYYKQYKHRFISRSNVPALADITLEQHLPLTLPSRQIAGPTNLGMKFTLYQYQSCPFCCKVRAFMDYYGIPYDVIEVNPVLRQQIKFSKYKKVPILLVQKNGEQEVMQLNDSSTIISALASYLIARNPQSKHYSETMNSIVPWYENLEVTNEDGKIVNEVVNKYFLMFGDIEARKYKKIENIIAEERNWRRWADDVLVHSLSPNIYRTFNESLRSFRHFSVIGEWEKHFSTWERYLIIYLGATAMLLIGKRLKKRHALKEDVRMSLYDSCNHWLNSIGKERKFMGGDKPNLADLRNQIISNKSLTRINLKNISQRYYSTERNKDKYISKQNINNNNNNNVVIVGGGFGGLNAAKRLGNSNVNVTLLDRRNFQLFQPLLYQVATGTLPPGDISVPQRVVLRKYRNVRVIKSTAYDIDPNNHLVFHEHGNIFYDYLIVATGVMHSYFGKDHWRPFAPGLKTVENAVEIRHKIFEAFELAEVTEDERKQRELITFVVIGGGPTGVELAGAIGELAHTIMVNDFRSFSPSKDTKIILIEGANNVLPVYPEKLRKSAHNSLKELGVTVLTETTVEDVGANYVRTVCKGKRSTINCGTIIWAAGVSASYFGKVVAERTNSKIDSNGRIFVNENCMLPNQHNMFVIGDMARVVDVSGRDVPGLAQAAIQEGRYVANVILSSRKQNDSPKPFKYRDYGIMAVIGMNHAVGDLIFVKVTGFVGWLVWAAVHIISLIDPGQRLRVYVLWAWKYFTRNQGDRLITGTTTLTSDKYKN